MDKYAALFVAMVCGVSAFLLFILYQSLKLVGGSANSSEVANILPLVIEADVSLLAFWGLVLVFRINELSSQRVEITNNLWEIGFRRDDIRLKLEESKSDEEKTDFLSKLYEELGKDATIRKDTIATFYEWETITTYLGLFAASFLVVSVCSGLYGISTTFHTQSVDAFTYFTPMVCLVVGIMMTIFALLSSSIRLEKSLEIRQ
jgi:hypothetical protein